MSNPTAKCPICGKESERDQNRAFPFCSRRCKAVDLGKWFNEEYRVPVRAEGEDEPSPEDDGELLH